MNVPAQRLPEPHAAEPSISGISAVHAKPIPFPRPSSVPPPIPGALPRPAPSAPALSPRFTDLQLLLGLALAAPLVALATFKMLESASSPDAAPAPLASPAPDSTEPTPGVVDARAMTAERADAPASAGSAPPVASVRAEPATQPTASAAELLARAEGLRAQGHHGRALHNYGLTLRIDSDNRWAMAGMIRSHLSQGHLSQARQWSRKLRRENPRWALSYVMQGNVLARAHDLRGARGAYERALSLAPGNAEARRQLAAIANPY